MVQNMEGYAAESYDGVLLEREIQDVLKRLIEQVKDKKRILLVPPDITRCYSYAGRITAYLYQELAVEREVKIMPAVGTHKSMTRKEKICFFGEKIPEDAYLEHDWRCDTSVVGTVPASYVEAVTEGRCSVEIETEVNRNLLNGRFDLILSIGQVVPHEVVGMANYSKNILVGLGGRQMINKSHMIGALCNLETIMGCVDTPVRKIFDYAESEFLKDIPLAYILTVTTQESGKTAVHGIFTGADRTPFERAASLAKHWNITCLPKRVHKVVAYLEEGEFSSTWVGNKAIFRTRMLIEDGGELLILAPGLRQFGENEEVDALIRRYGYSGSEHIKELVSKGCFEDADMVPAHMIHSSSENRFKITYAVNPELLSQAEIEQVGYGFMDIRDALARYKIEGLEDGFHVLKDGENIYVVKSPALGLWKVE